MRSSINSFGSQGYEKSSHKIQNQNQWYNKYVQKTTSDHVFHNDTAIAYWNIDFRTGNNNVLD